MTDQVRDVLFALREVEGRLSEHVRREVHAMGERIEQFVQNAVDKASQGRAGHATASVKVTNTPPTPTAVVHPEPTRRPRTAEGVFGDRVFWKQTLSTEGGADPTTDFSRFCPAKRFDWRCVERTIPGLRDTDRAPGEKRSSRFQNAVKSYGNAIMAKTDDTKYPNAEAIDNAISHLMLELGQKPSDGHKKTLLGAVAGAVRVWCTMNADVRVKQPLWWLRGRKGLGLGLGLG